MIDAAAQELSNQDQKYETIVVYGDKIQRSFLDTTSSVQVLNKDVMANRSDQTALDLLRFSANVSASPDGEGFSIRGIKSGGVTTDDGSALSTVVVDDIPVVYGINSDGLSVWDIEQIELWRGPRSTIQGRNTLAGALILHSKDPTNQAEGAARVKVGGYNTHQLAVMQNTPLLEDELALRIAMEERYTDGFLKNTTRNEEDWDRRESKLIRTKLSYKPKDWPRLSALLSLMHSQQEYGDDRVRSADPFLRQADDNFRAFRDYKRTGISAKIDLELNGGWIARSITGYSDLDKVYKFDADFGPTPQGAANWPEFEQSVNQEVHFQYQDDSFQAITGIYFSRADVDQQKISEQPFLASQVGLGDLASLIPYLTIDLNLALKRETEAAAWFGHIDYALSDNWSIQTGLRWDYHQSKRHIDNQFNILTDVDALVDGKTIEFQNRVVTINSLTKPFILSALGLPYQSFNEASLNFSRQASTDLLGNEQDNVWLPKLALIYHDNEWSTGLSYTKGYRRSGVSVNIVRGSISQYEPEFTDNFELFYRAQWRDQSIGLNANLFYVRWRDQQVLTRLSDNEYDSQVENAGRSHLKGGELEFQFRPKSWPEFSAWGSIGYVKTGFERFKDSMGTDYQGNEFPEAPRLSTALGLEYRSSNGFIIETDISYRSYGYAGVANELRSDSRAIVGLVFGVDKPNWAINLSIQNLFDREYISRPNVWGDAFYATRVGEPRVVSINSEYRW
ncbi:TonB-dependent receptor [Microbulbifer epialgicus]|uniref:TonB-dependent receptor n=1 Tax=Microbulbifer epialgicus TaxID=393907 RepID=A0ABV4NV98_9GAMM